MCIIPMINQAPPCGHHQATVFPRLESRMQSARPILDVEPAKTISSSAETGMKRGYHLAVGQIQLETTWNYR